jgi:hypothetical protein
VFAAVGVGGPRGSACEPVEEVAEVGGLVGGRGGVARELGPLNFWRSGDFLCQSSSVHMRVRSKSTLTHSLLGIGRSTTYHKSGYWYCSMARRQLEFMPCSRLHAGQ